MFSLSSHPLHGSISLSLPAHLKCFATIHPSSGSFFLFFPIVSLLFSRLANHSISLTALPLLLRTIGHGVPRRSFHAWTIVLSSPEILPAILLYHFGAFLFCDLSFEGLISSHSIILL